MSRSAGSRAVSAAVPAGVRAAHWPVFGLMVLALSTGCTGPRPGAVNTTTAGVTSPGPPSTTAAGSSGPSGTESAATHAWPGSARSGASRRAPAAGPETLIRAAVAGFNTSAGTVAGQQRVLATLVAVGQRAAQRSCPTATATLTLEPVYTDLAPAPDWRPPTGVLAGTVYSLPALIRIHRDGRIIGTDLVDLHLAVDGGAVAFPVLCIA